MTRLRFAPFLLTVCLCSIHVGCSESDSTMLPEPEGEAAAEQAEIENTMGNSNNVEMAVPK